MPSELPTELSELVAFQRGTLTSRQALVGGLTRDIIQSRVRQGRWQRLHTGVYAVFSGEPGRSAVLWAAVLRAGPGAVPSHHTAAELATLADQPTRMADQPARLIHVTVPIRRRVASIPGVVIHRSDRLDLARHPSLTPPQTRVEDTVLDLAESAATLDDAYGWITRALGRRLTTQARLRAAICRRSRLRWRRELTQALTADFEGAHSSLEHRYLRDVERPHALPRGRRQAQARRGTRTEYRDVLYDEYDVAVELDGRAAHPGDRRWLDIYRDNAAAADGVLTLRYGWVDVTQRPCLVAAQVAEVLRRRGFSTARPCALGCAVSAGIRP
jgi:hypothetical protein